MTNSTPDSQNRIITLAPHTLNLIDGLNYYTKCMIIERHGFYITASSLLRFLKDNNLSSLQIIVDPDRSNNFVDSEMVENSPAVTKTINQINQLDLALQSIESAFRCAAVADDSRSAGIIGNAQDLLMQHQEHLKKCIADGVIH
jgi:hypothetical protein